MLGGPKSAFGSAVACGILLGVFEGVGVLLSRVFSEGQRPQMAPREYQHSFLSLSVR
jgi:import inner membrane translocase subunit TIM17